MQYKIFIYIVCIGLLVSCQREVNTAFVSQGIVAIDFKPEIKGTALDFTGNYTNDHNETYTVKAFKFCIHKIELIKDNNEVVNVSNDYHLLDAANPTSLQLSARVSSSSYKSLAFTIGVDSARNVSGAQTGALDPTNGMFWTWNTGYIMAKFEGTSPVSTQPGNRFEYHIGGFKGNENVVRRIELPVPGQSGFQLAQDKTATITVATDLNKWFSGVNQLPIASNAVCMTPGALAKSFAENYYSMFTITDVENN